MGYLESILRRKTILDEKETITSPEAEKILGLSKNGIKILENEGVLHPIKKGKDSLFSKTEITKVKQSKGPSLYKETKEIELKIEQGNASSLAFIKKLILIFIIGFLIYIFLVAILSIFFMVSPSKTIDWLGYLKKPTNYVSLKQKDQDTKVLGASTDEEPYLFKSIFMWISRRSLDLVKNINPESYKQITNIMILDANDLFSLNGEGKVEASVPLKISESSQLEVVTPDLINNLNAQFLEGRKVGNEVGDIAVIGEDGEIAGLNILGLTNSNLSGSAGISNANLANSSITITSDGIISGGGTLALGGKMALTASESDTLSSVTGRGSSTSTTINLSSSSNSITAGTLTVNGDAFTDLTGNGLNINSGTLSVSDLTSSLFSNTDISQWANDSGYITAPSSSTLTNKTISGSSNTLSNIGNSSLSNSSLTIDTSGGLSGGGLLSLGGTLTLTNSGVTSIAGTTNQITASASTGDVTLSLPQNIHSGASPTFSVLNLANTSNQILLGTTNIGTLTWSPSSTRTITIPDTTDTLVARATVDTLTNKTLTSPTINGTVATTGLTLPTFVASGSITGSGSPTISSFGSYNGLTLTSASDGFTVAGGTSSRTLTVTGANITIGSTITPTSTGTLSVQSNGASSLTVDTGGAATLNLGNTNANALTVGRSGVTTTINGVAAANNLTIGAGTTITKHLSGTNTFDAAGVTLGSCADIGTVTVTGAATGDTVTATPTPVSGGIETLLLIWNAYVSATNTITIRACSVATVSTQNPASQTWRADVWQH